MSKKTADHVKHALAAGWRGGVADWPAAAGLSRADLPWALTLCLLALLPGLPYILHHQTIIDAFLSGNSENLNEWMIYRRFIADSFAHGLLPAWTPQLLCGMPFIGWPHTSVFAPPRLIYALLPFSQAAVA